MKLNISDEFKIGLLAIVALTIFFLGINFLRGKDIFFTKNKYYAIYDNANGLSSSDPVLLYGKNVGKVEFIDLVYRDEPRIVIQFSVDKDSRIPNNSTAKIFSSDLLGSKALEIVPGNSGVLAQSGDTLLSDFEKSITQSLSEVLSPLQHKSVTLITSLDSFITVLQGMLNQETKDDIEGSFGSLAGSLKNIERATGRFDALLATESETLQEIFKNVENITRKFDSSLDTFNYIGNNLASISDSIAAINFSATIARANNALEEVDGIVSKINRGEGTLGLLLNDPKLYNNLEQASKDMDRLLIDLRRNPGRYLNFSALELSIGGGKNKAPQ